jgi:8-oxo-dGTP pyrophosphatase MutT (NUDIX family)
MTPTIYVLGFAFEPYLNQVLLINKTKPEWQVGMLNGVGGKVEPNETIFDAMVREFEEETHQVTGLRDWIRFAVLRYEPAEIIVHCFTAKIQQFSPWKGNPNGETARWRSVDTAYEPNYIPNLRWLIPMAKLKHSKPEWQETCEAILL